METKYTICRSKYKIIDGITVYRIKCVNSFYCHGTLISKGDIGGYVENDYNLSQHGCCWIFDDAVVRGNARLTNSATVHNNAIVEDNAQVCEFSHVKGNALIKGISRICGNSIIKEYTALNNAFVVDSCISLPKFFSAFCLGSDFPDSDMSYFCFKSANINSHNDIYLIPMNITKTKKDNFVLEVYRTNDDKKAFAISTTNSLKTYKSEDDLFFGILNYAKDFIDINYLEKEKSEENILVSFLINQLYEQIEYRSLNSILDRYTKLFLEEIKAVSTPLIAERDKEIIRYYILAQILAPMIKLICRFESSEEDGWNEYLNYLISTIGINYKNHKLEDISSTFFYNEQLFKYIYINEAQCNKMMCIFENEGVCLYN